MTNGIIASGGTMVWSNSWIAGTVTVQAGGQLFCAAPVGTYSYWLTLTNQGTVTGSSGSMNSGGTRIYNSSLWQITGNNFIGYNVTLVRDGVVVGPLLTPQGLTNGIWKLNASGALLPPVLQCHQLKLPLGLLAFRACLLKQNQPDQRRCCVC